MGWQWCVDCILYFLKGIAAMGDSATHRRDIAIVTHLPAL